MRTIRVFLYFTACAFVLSAFIYHFLGDNVPALIVAYGTFIILLLSDISFSISKPRKDPWDE